MQREKPTTGEVYHIYNRGVDKCDIFLNTKDYVRFVHDLWEFNDHKPSTNTIRQISGNGLSSKMCEDRLRTLNNVGRKKLVEILAWCLMPNHFHLMLRQLVDDGITKFMRKLGTGYVNAFNLTRERVGPLFQGVYKFKHVNHEAHLFYLPHYIHLNPVDLAPNKNREELLKFLDSYRWSSFRDYCGKKNFSSLINRSFVKETFKSPSAYRDEISEWLVGSGEANPETMGDILLD